MLPKVLIEILLKPHCIFYFISSEKLHL